MERAGAGGVGTVLGKIPKRTIPQKARGKPYFHESGSRVVRPPRFERGTFCSGGKNKRTFIAVGTIIALGCASLPVIKDFGGARERANQTHHLDKLPRTRLFHYSVRDQRQTEMAGLLRTSFSRAAHIRLAVDAHAESTHPCECISNRVQSACPRPAGRVYRPQFRRPSPQRLR